MFVGGVVNFVFCEKVNKKAVVTSWCGYNIAFDAVIAGYFGCIALHCNFTDLSSNGMFGDITKRPWDRLDELVQESL